MLFEPGQILINKKNEKIGLRVEPNNGQLFVQHVDIVDGCARRSFVFEQAIASKLKKDYFVSGERFVKNR